jgi:hypothetical protein
MVALRAISQFPSSMEMEIGLVLAWPEKIQME